MAQDIELDEALVVHRSPLAFGPLFLLFLFVSLLSVYITFEFPMSVQKIDLGLFAFHLPLSGLLPMMIGGFILHKLYDAKYVIGPGYLRGTEGLLSMQKSDVLVEIGHIRGIEISRSLYGRMVNTGTLAIGTAAQEDEELIMRYIADPSRVRDIIIERLSVLKEKEKEIEGE